MREGIRDPMEASMTRFVEAVPFESQSEPDRGPLSPSTS